MTTDTTESRVGMAVPAPRQAPHIPDGPSRSRSFGGTPTAVSARAGSTHPAPSSRRLLGVCGWAALLGLAGMVIGIRGLIIIVAGHPAGWFAPILILVGLSGIALCAGAFLSVHYRRQPWLLLGAGTLALITATIITASA